jgi:type IV secretory pathway VirB10-like protein
MSKRLITATAVFAFGALAFGALATTADARPHRYVDQSYSDDDDDDDRPVQRYRRQAHKPKPTKKEASKREQQPQEKQPQQQQLAVAKPEQQSQQQRQQSDEPSQQQAAKPSEPPHVPLRRSPLSRREVAGASRNCLTPAARALLGRIEAQFGAMQIISTCRPGARIAGSGRISRHASGNAIDFSAGGRKGAVVRWLIANHKSGGTMTYSDMSHIHVDIGPHFVSLGAYSGG